MAWYTRGATMLGPGPKRRRCGAWRGVYDCGITFSLTAGGRGKMVFHRRGAETAEDSAENILRYFGSGPAHAAAVLQGQVRHLHYQGGLER